MYKYMCASSDNQFQLDSHLRCPRHSNCSNMEYFVSIFTVQNTKRGDIEPTVGSEATHLRSPSPAHPEPLQTPASLHGSAWRGLHQNIPASHDPYVPHLLQTVKKDISLNIGIGRHFLSFAKIKYGTKHLALFILCCFLIES